MPPPVTIRPDCDDIQIAGYVPRWMELPSGLIGVQRTVRIAPERIQHIKLRRPAWWRFCLEHTPNTLRHPDFAGQRRHGEQRSSHREGVLDSAYKGRYDVEYSRAVRTERSPSPFPDGNLGDPEVIAWHGFPSPLSPGRWEAGRGTLPKDPVDA